MSICLRIGAALICAASTTACSHPTGPSTGQVNASGFALAGAVASPPAQQLGMGAKSAATQQVTVDFGGRLPGAVYQLSLSLPGLRVIGIGGPAKPAGPFEVTVADSRSALVVFKPLRIGSLRAEFSVLYADGRSSLIVVRADVRPLILENMAFSFPDTRIGDSSRVRLFIRKVADAVVDVSLHGSPRVEFDKRDCVLHKESCAIDAIFTPSDVRESETWRVTLKTSEWTSNSDISLSGRSLPKLGSGAFSFSPSSLEFGDVVVGASKEAAIRVGYSGKSMEVIRGGIRAPFSVKREVCYLTHTLSCDFEVTFAPTE